MSQTADAASDTDDVYWIKIHTRPRWPCDTLRLLALPYADHEQYREEWKP